MILVRKINGKYQVVECEGLEITIYRVFKTFNQAENFAVSYKAYRPICNQTKRIE